MALGFTYHHLPSLPSNAWSASLQRKGETVHVFHGSGVEARDRFFAEAVWNDSFDAEGMGKATLFFGTGCHICGVHAVFQTGSDQSAPLYSLRRKSELILSNSIYHLMVMAGTEPVRYYPFYTYDLLRNARAGIGQPQGTLLHAGDGLLKVHFNTKVRIDRDLDVSFVNHHAVKEPVDFESLLGILRMEADRLFRNGADGGRSSIYSQTVLVSAGYDSLMNGVVCAGLGSECFLTVVDGRSTSPEADSGNLPMGFLGVHAHEVDRHVHYTHHEPPDAEFALASISNYPHLSGCEERLARTLLVNGSNGDVIWGACDYRFSGSDWLDWELLFLPCLTSTEYRLRVGYIDVGLQNMFIRHAQAVFGISASKEMDAFRVDPAYDRPIPRRVIEESGIPRGSFATRKMATGFKHFSTPTNMHPDALEAYRSFVDRSIPKGPVRWFSKGLYAIEHFLHRHWFRSHQQRRNDDPDRFRLVAVDGFRINVPWLQSFLFQWSFEELRGRYTAAASAKRSLKH
jgi:hypothetical protein